MIPLLPRTENWPANVLASVFSEDDLSTAIAYLELVITGEVKPGPEIYSLGIDLYNWNMYEVEAVQRKLALAIYKRRENENIRVVHGGK